MTLQDLCARPSAWLGGVGPRSDIVLSSRVRLARNLAGFPFPHRADDRVRQHVFDEVAEVATARGALPGASTWDLEALTSDERRILVERHLASPHLLEGSGARGVVVAAGETRGLMINEEDHVRIRAVVSGFDLKRALESAVALDCALESGLDYAVSARWGYLTACPTNVGTGLRASTLVHLPALALAGELKKVHRAVGEMGVVVRGWFGEGSGALGDYYQVSNQRTLGRTEEDQTAELARVASRVLELEVETREKIRESGPRMRRLEDRIHRAYATLRFARLLSVQQLMACASDVRLGKWFGFLREVPLELLNRLALDGQPSHLCRRCGSATGEEANWRRAEFVRAEFRSALAEDGP